MKNKSHIIEVVKAAKRGQREAELEFSTGFTAINKVFRSKKQYSRKEKHKNSW